MKTKIFSILALAILTAFPCAKTFAGATKIACVGDSITFGYVIPEREKNAYPTVLGQFLGNDFEVKNFGNPGKTCGDYPGEKARKRWLGDNKEHADAVAFKADVYVANLGINDTGAWWDAKLFVEGYNNLIKDWLGARRGVSLLIWTNLAPDFRGEIGKAAFPGNVFAPKFKFPLKDNGSSAKRKDAENLLRKIAAKHKAIELDAYSPLAAHPEMYTNDGLHPNAAGARRIAEFTFAKLATSKIPNVKIPRLKPEISAGTDEVVLENKGKIAILLDDSWALGNDAKAEFVFENATVIAPGEKISVKLGGEKDQKDPGFQLVSAKLKNAKNVRLVPVPKKK